MRAPFHRWLGGMLVGILLAACAAQPADAGRFGFGFRHKTQTIVAQPPPPPATVTYDTTMGASVDSNGFTSLPLRGGAHRYFVKNSGSDANTCSAAQSPTTPKATIASGFACLVGGNGDQLLLAEGSTFNENIPTNGLSAFSLDGFSATYPTVISSYDPADPSNEAKIGMGHQRNARPILLSGGGQVYGGGPHSYFAIKGLDFNPGNSAGWTLAFNGDGTSHTGGASYVLIENNILRYSGIIYVDGWDGVAAPLDRHFIIRNNSIYGNWASNDSTHIGGIYADGVDGITIEDNVIWHAGWNTANANRDTGPNTGGPVVFNHPIYLQANTGVEIVRRNLMMDNSADAGIFRGQTVTLTQNVAIKSPSGWGIGPGNPAEFSAYPGGDTDEASYNLSIGAIDLATGSPSGPGYTLTNQAIGSRLHHNLLIYSDATPNAADTTVSTTGGSCCSASTRPTYTDFEYNTAFHWSASDAVVLSQAGTPITASSYVNNVWDHTLSVYPNNVYSHTATFPLAYTQAQLYTALTPTFASIADYASLVTYAVAHPEAHVQRTLLTLAFAGYGMGVPYATDTTAPSLTLPTGTTTGAGTATIGVTTNDATGNLYYELLAASTPINSSYVKFGLAGANADGTGNPGVAAGSLTINSAGTKAVNLSSLPSGTYYAHFTHEDGAANKSADAVSSAFTIVGVAYATWNPADQLNTTLSGGNLTAQISGSLGTFGGTRATKAITAKAYWEVGLNIEGDGPALGIADASASFAGAYWGNGGNVHFSAPFLSGGHTYRFAEDPVAHKFWIGDTSGCTWNSGDPATGTGGTDVSGMTGSPYPAFQSGASSKVTANFGQSATLCAAPAGFSAP